MGDEGRRQADETAAWLRAEAGRARARAPMVIQLVVGDVRLAAIVGTLYHGRRDDGVHCSVADVEAAAAVVALPALLAGEAAAASQLPALALHESHGICTDGTKESTELRVQTRKKPGRQEA